MTQEEIKDMIKVLVKVVEINKGWFGDSDTMDAANMQIRELIKDID